MLQQQDPALALPIPCTDKDVLDLIDPFAIALAQAIGATAQIDNAVTVQEYQALANAAENLEQLSAFPGSMRAIVLQAVLGHSSLATSLHRLRALAKSRPEPERAAVFKAVQPLIQLQAERSQNLSKEWAAALHMEESASYPLISEIQATLTPLFARFRAFATPKESLAQRAARFADIYGDPQLAAISTKALADPYSVPEPVLGDGLAAAVERAFRSASSILKTQEALDEQVHVADRFLATIEALAEQMRLRLQSIKERLDLQHQLFNEDLQEFVRKAADSVELSMRDLMEGRTNWADKTIWEQFKNRGAFTELLAHFQPLKHRYERLFSLWQKELDLFAREAGAVRAGVFSSIDPRAFAGLLPTAHPTVAVKNTMDRAANATLTILGAGGAVATAMTLTGHGAAILGLIATGPVGPAVLIVAASAAGWKILSTPEARKRGLVQEKRQVLERKLSEMLQKETFNHEQAAQDIMKGFHQAAFAQYSPLVIGARMAALRARLETQVVHRILADTRRVLLKGN